MSTCSWCGSHNHARSQCNEDPLPLLGEVPARNQYPDDDNAEPEDD